MSPNASHWVRPGLSSAASLMTTLLISFDQEVLNQQLNLVTPEYPFFESPCLPTSALGRVRPELGLSKANDDHATLRCFCDPYLRYRKAGALASRIVEDQELDLLATG